MHNFDTLKNSRIRATTIGDMLLSAADIYSDDIAVILPEERIKYGELAQSSLRLARSLRAVGVDRGDHVGVYLPTCSEFLRAMFATSLLGAVVVPVNARYQPAEISYVTENADLRVLITSNKFVDNVDLVARLVEALNLKSLDIDSDKGDLRLSDFPELRAVVSLSGEEVPQILNFNDFIDLGRSVDEDEVHISRLQTRLGAPALMLYTSGTTANPKGCLISHESMVRSSIALGRRYQLTRKDKFWSPLPMYHIAAILPLIAIFDVGGTYLTAEHFEAGSALKLLEDEKVTATYPCFWTIMGDLVQHPDFPKRDLSNVRLMNANFAVQPEAVANSMMEAMPDTVYVGTFGMTETAGTVTTGKVTDTQEQRHSKLGMPMPGLEVKIIDPDTGMQVATGDRGECLIRGYSTFLEYYKSPDKTAEALDQDDWFHSGDICSVDAEGQLMFHGRLKDMLKVGGENVAAAEIEACLQQHDAVQLAQVIGVPDSRYQEVPAAFIELNKGMSASEDELLVLCKERMAGFKVPRHIRFVEEWPMSSTKIQKFKLAKLLDNVDV